MSAVPAETSRWSWRRWALIAVGGLIVHAGLAFWLGERAPAAGVASKVEPLFKMAVNPTAIRVVNEAPGLSSPTLFALPSVAGFSGQAWLNLKPTPLVTAEWTEPPQFLPLPTNDLGNLFTLFVATNRHNGSVLEEVLKPRATAMDVLLLNDTLMTQSLVRVEGPLAYRALLMPLIAPNPAQADVLTNTVLQLKVNSAGFTESAIVLESCGVKPVDEQALLLAGNARFRPLTAVDRPNARETDSTTWGKLVVQWFTVPPVNTNAVAAGAR